MRFHAICGLPRSASTLFCNILNQNPLFYATDTSILPALIGMNVKMWSTSPEFRARLGLDRELEETRILKTVQGICDSWTYDRPKTAEVIFSKNRMWSQEALMLKSAFPKSELLCLIRDPRDIFASYEFKLRQNALLDEAEMPIAKSVFHRADIMFGSPGGLYGRALDGIQDLVRRKIDFCEIKAEAFTKSPLNTMRRVYEYINEPYFDHQFKAVENVSREPDHITLNHFPHVGCGEVEPIKSYWKEVLSEEIGDLIYTKFKWFYDRFDYSK